MLSLGISGIPPGVPLRATTGLIQVGGTIAVFGCLAVNSTEGERLRRASTGSRRVIPSWRCLLKL